MVTLREAVQKALADIDAMPYWNAETLERIESDLRQALDSDSKPCACCGEGKARLSVTRVCDSCGSEYAGQDEMDAAKRMKSEQLAEPVAVVGSDFQLLYTRLNWSENLKVGDKLYASLQPAQQPTIPPGYKLVPVEPTREMLTAWIKADVVSNRTAPDLYRAMLAVAPEAPAQQPLTDEQINAMWQQSCREHFSGLQREIHLARSAEAAHGINR